MSGSSSGPVGSSAVDGLSYAAIIDAPFGRIGIRAGADAIREIVYLPFDVQLILPVGELASEAVRQLRTYLRDPRHVFDLPCRVQGTVHQRAVWACISEIPCGQTRTYGDLASRLGSGARAVGAACGSNPIPVIVPCHRVVAAGGKLGGFMHSRGNFQLDVKRWLLMHEAT